MNLLEIGKLFGILHDLGLNVNAAALDNDSRLVDGNVVNLLHVSDTPKDHLHAVTGDRWPNVVG